MPDLNIRLRAGSEETKTQQIFNQIASAILSGKFTRGDALTSERALAEQLGVSRNIVRNAYRRLEEHGLVETFSTSGRRVRGAKKSRTAAGQAGVTSRDRRALRTAPARPRGNSTAKGSPGRRRG
ncbi:MAG: winged helix-turn-helix domain-containing protein [Pyrinomonadaceae bacterium]